MFQKHFLIGFSIFALLSFLLPGQVLAAASSIIMRVSVSSGEIQGNDRSQQAGISANGLYVTFSSFANNLVTADTNGVQDIFLRNTQTNTTTRISVASSGSQGNFQSYDPEISASGRYVVFTSEASNLVVGDTNGGSDVFLRDTQMNTTSRVSIASDESQANANSYSPIVSADGRYVAFISDATNLVVGDTNGWGDIFLRDRLNGTTILISVASNGTQIADSINDLAISGSGRYVVFSSPSSVLVPGDTNGVDDIFLRDTQLNQTTRLSVTSSGTQATASSWDNDISSDGRYVVFTSEADNLVIGDTNGVQDIFLRNLQTNTTTLISMGLGKAQANNYSFLPSISADGRYVTFESRASNLVAEDTNNASDIFVSDTQTNTTIRVSIASDGSQSNGGSTSPMISANRRYYVAFHSIASNLVPDDTNSVSDVFISELGTLPVPRPQSAVLPATGFAANHITNLPKQPAAKAYTDQGMTLDIPSLKLKSTIVGVPRGSDGSWDLFWLGNSTGYLAGTTFPTWAGNSVLTAHVYGANGQPGPFADLGKLWSGQRIIIHAWEQQYIYEVRSVNRWVDPLNTEVLTRPEEFPWLTLITCRDYDEKTDSYRWRTVVRAVLVKILDVP